MKWTQRTFLRHQQWPLDNLRPDDRFNALWQQLYPPSMHCLSLFALWLWFTKHRWGIHSSKFYSNFNSFEIFQNLVTVAYGHFPDGTSSRVLAHLAQRVVLNTFNFYDYGREKNLQLYRSALAPEYNISRIDNQYIILVSGANDYLSDPIDVDYLRSKLSG